MFKMAIASFSMIFALSLSAGPVKTAPSAKPATALAKPEAAAPAKIDSSDPKAVEKTTVYIKSGNRYHNKGCQYLKNKGTAITVGDAVKQGYAPCNVCKPPKIKRSEG